MQDEKIYSSRSSSVATDPAANLNCATAKARPSETGSASGENESGASNIVLRELIQVLFPALLLAMTIHLFLAQATIVYGRSMEPNLHERQRLIVDKFTYRFVHAPRRNDIVVIKLPEMNELLVKRIVGLPYETISIQNGLVHINDIPLPEPFPHDLFPQNMPPQRLGPLEYFVLGDNRGNSNDSRTFGPVIRDDIKGRVWFRYWPLNELRAF